MVEDVLTHGELFAGISGFGLGFERAGIETRWAVEIDPACRRVLAHHHPDATIFEDVREVGAHNLDPVDIITFGFPCQDLSVAGKRKGLIGERSGLFWEAIRVIKELRPAIIVAENVPGLLSSHAGRDMAHVLWGILDAGYSDVSWAVLDAQWFGVPQRRRRVFIVGSTRAERAAEILALSDGLSGHPAPRRTTREDVAGTPGSNAQGGFRTTDLDQMGAFIPETIGCLTQNLGTGGPNEQGAASNHIVVTHALTGEGFDASEDGTGRGTPIIAWAHETAPALTSNYGKQPDNSDTNAGPNIIAIQDTAMPREKKQNGIASDAPRYTLDGHGAHAVAFQQNQRDEVRDLGDVAGALQAEPGMKQQNYIAFTSKDYGADAGDIAPTLRAMPHDTSHANGGGQVAVAFTNRGYDSGTSAETLRAGSHGALPMVATHDVFPTLAASTGGPGSQDWQQHAAVTSGMSVRRLTPTECERLQGFPDGHTAIDGASDSTRYRQLGNAVCVNVAEWLGRQIARVAAE